MSDKDSQSQAIHDVLRRYWGYDGFRPLQEEIITSVLEGRDTVGLLPTGGGKSLTFQVPAMVLEGLTLVVTPLISLMKDQVDNLKSHGIKALYFHSGMQRRESRLAIDRCRLGKVKIAYVSPEKLRSRSFVDELRLFNVSLIVVDEAHCISQWGYDFRPSYLKIAETRRMFPGVPVLALTASATRRVVDDIMKQLEFRAPNVMARSFARDNLSYIARQGDYKEGMLLRVLRGTTGTAIVYVRSRKRTREIAMFLQSQGISADYYHAGLAPEEKEERQNAWKEDRVRVIVATNAFGMGIDKPDVRVVAHIDLPPSLEEYYQEAGRAGRDGKPAYAVLLVSRADKGLLTRRISESFPDIDTIRHVYEMAGNFLEVAVGDGYERVCEFNFNLFCNTFDIKPQVAHSALMILTRNGYLEFVEETTTRSRMMVTVNKRELYDLPLDEVTDSVLQMILRTYTGLFTDYVYISEPLIARQLGLTDYQVYESLLYLSRLHAVTYVPRKTTPYIVWTTSREEPRYIVLPREVYDEQRENMERRVRAMQEFAFTTTECRQAVLLRYFGEEHPSPCGKCDVCRASRRPAGKTAQASEAVTMRSTVEYLASQPGGHPLDYILEQIAPSRRARALELVRRMLDEGDLKTGADGRIVSGTK